MLGQWWDDFAQWSQWLILEDVLLNSIASTVSQVEVFSYIHRQTMYIIKLCRMSHLIESVNCIFRLL